MYMYKLWKNLKNICAQMHCIYIYIYIYIYKYILHTYINFEKNFCSFGMKRKHKMNKIVSTSSCEIEYY